MSTLSQHGADRATQRIIVVGDGGARTKALMERLTARRARVTRSSPRTIADRVLAGAPDLVIVMGDAARDGGLLVVQSLARDPASALVPVVVIGSDTAPPGSVPPVSSGAAGHLALGLGPDALADRAMELARRHTRPPRPRPSAPAPANWKEGVEAMLGNFEEVSDTGLKRLPDRAVPRAPADPKRLAGASVLLIDTDSGRADGIAYALRSEHALVRVWDGNPATLGRLRGKDAQVALIGDDHLEQRGYDALHALHGDTRLRWTSLSLVRWEELLPSQAREPELPVLAGYVVPLLAADRALTEDLAKHREVDAGCESLGPGRTLRALARQTFPVRVCFAGPRATVEVGLHQGLIVGAWGEAESMGPVEGLAAVALAMGLATAQVHAEQRANPAPPNVMLPLEEAMEQSVALAPSRTSSAPPPILHDGDERHSVPARMSQREVDPSMPPVFGAMDDDPTHGGARGDSIVQTIRAPSMQPVPDEAKPSLATQGMRRTVQAPAERLLAALEGSGPSSETPMDQLTQPVPPPTSLAPSRAVEQVQKLTLKRAPIPMGAPQLPPLVDLQARTTGGASAPANDTETAPPAEDTGGADTMSLQPSDMMGQSDSLDLDVDAIEGGLGEIQLPSPERPRVAKKPPPPPVAYDALDPPSVAPAAMQDVPPVDYEGLDPASVVPAAREDATTDLPAMPARGRDSLPDLSDLGDEDTGVFDSSALPSQQQEPEPAPDALDELFAPLTNAARAMEPPSTATIPPPHSEPAPAGVSEEDAQPDAEHGNLASLLEPSVPAGEASEPAPEVGPEVIHGSPQTPTGDDLQSAAPAQRARTPWLGLSLTGTAAALLLGVLVWRGPALLAKLRPPVQAAPPPPAAPVVKQPTVTEAPPAAQPEPAAQPAEGAAKESPPPEPEPEPEPAPAAEAELPQPSQDDAEERADSMVSDARRLARKGNLETAQRMLEEAGRLDPRSARPAATLARLLMDENHHTDAVKWAREAARRRPRRAQLHLLLGDALVQAGKERDARAAWKRASELRPGDPRILARMAKGPEKKRRRRRRNTRD